MSPERLLKHFERIADAPDAVARLRRFILDLAVRGKLVEQDPKDEPAAPLFRQMKAAVSERQGKGRVHSAETGDDDGEESPFPVPSNWIWLRLRDLDPEYQNGESSRGCAAGVQTVVLRLADIKNGRISTADTRTLCLTPEAAEKYRLSKGDILIIRVNGSTELVGRFIVCEHETEAIYCDHFIRLRVRTELASPVFLGLVGNSPLVRQQVGRLFVTTAGQKTINQGHLGSLVFPFPPYGEQKRIVAKVDELMGLCDELEAAQAKRESRRDRLVAATLHGLNNGAAETKAETGMSFPETARFYFNHLPRLTTRPEHIHQLRQTILNLAVRGRLVPQDTNDEPASVMFKRIQAEKTGLLKEGAIGRFRPGAPIKPEEIQDQLPDGWDWTRIGELLLGDSQNGYSKKPDDAPDGIPILRISAGTARRDGIVAEEEHKLIGGVSPAQRDQYELRPGDLLACRFNGNRSFVGRLSLYRGYLGIRPIYPDKLIRIRLIPPAFLPELLRYFAESTIVRQDIENYCATTVGNWGISSSNLKSVKIPVPPLREQQRIVAKVDELMALCDELETHLTEATTTRRQLLEATLAEALCQTEHHYSGDKT